MNAPFVLVSIKYETLEIILYVLIVNVLAYYSFAGVGIPDIIILKSKIFISNGPVI